MSWYLGIVLLVTTAGGMEMRETVERMVMVRRTGSDLQPAATGYIYRSDNNGPASVIKLGEGDINKHFDNIPKPLYEQPKAFVAPIPVAAGPFYNKDDDGKAASQTNEYVIPVVEEKNEETGEQNNGDLGEYAADYGNYKTNFDDYILKNFGHFVDDGHHNEHGGGSDFGEQGHSAYGEKGGKGYASSHHYGKGDAGDYHNEKHDSFSIEGAGGHGKHYDEADAHGTNYAHGNTYKGGDHGHKAAHSKGEEIDGFHKLLNKDVYKEDKDFYDEEGLKGGFNKFASGHAYHGSNAGGFGKGGSHESGHDEDDFSKHGLYDHGVYDVNGVGYSATEDEDRFHHHHGGYGVDGGHLDGKGYGYAIKH